MGAASGVDSAAVTAAEVGRGIGASEEELLLVARLGIDGAEPTRSVWEALAAATAVCGSAPPPAAARVLLEMLKDGLIVVRVSEVP